MIKEVIKIGLLKECGKVRVGRSRRERGVAGYGRACFFLAFCNSKYSAAWLISNSPDILYKAVYKWCVYSIFFGGFVQKPPIRIN